MNDAIRVRLRPLSEKTRAHIDIEKRIGRDLERNPQGDFVIYDDELELLVKPRSTLRTVLYFVGGVIAAMILSSMLRWLVT